MEDNYIVIGINEECEEIFTSFSDLYPSFITPINHASFIGGEQVQEFLINISPAFLSAMSAYLIARIQVSKSIKIKKGDIEIELKNMDISPRTVYNMILKLELGNKNE